MPTIEQLEGLLAREPDDLFLNFGMAMALASAARPSLALERFDRILELDPKYVPAYFQKGKVLVDQGEEDLASDVLREGIRVARAIGDQFAAGEMTDLLAILDPD